MRVLLVETLPIQGSGTRARRSSMPIQMSSSAPSAPALPSSTSSAGATSAGERQLATRPFCVIHSALRVGRETHGPLCAARSLEMARSDPGPAIVMTDPIVDRATSELRCNWPIVTPLICCSTLICLVAALVGRVLRLGRKQRVSGSRPQTVLKQTAKARPVWSSPWSQPASWARGVHTPLRCTTPAEAGIVG